jgi:hypothetical protein
MGFVNGFGGENKGDGELFRRWSLPFAPMVLQVGKGSHEETSSLRNLYLGVAGAAFGVDAAKLAASFHCGIGTQANVTFPSPKMGFLPSGAWKPVSEPESYFSSLGVSPASVREVLSEVVALSIAAVVRDLDWGIRVVRIGISDNEAGVHFPSTKSPKVKLGDKLRDGREIKFLQELGKGVVFYEST